MANFPIQFFQAAATVIPTLLIAVAVGVKQGVTFAGFYERARSSRHKIGLLVLTLGFPLMIVIGELAALRAIVRGSGNELEAVLAWGAIMNCLLIIYLELVVPIAEKMKRKGFGAVMNGVSIFGGILGLYVVLIAAGVVPL